MEENSQRNNGGTAPTESACTRSVPMTLRVPDPQIESMFTYHRPTPEQVAAYGELTEQFKDTAYLIKELCPDSHERSLALTKLQELRMFANASIAIHGLNKS